jgi:hypothetical protein
MKPLNYLGAKVRQFILFLWNLYFCSLLLAVIRSLCLETQSNNSEHFKLKLTLTHSSALTSFALIYILFLSFAHKSLMSSKSSKSSNINTSSRLKFLHVFVKFRTIYFPDRPYFVFRTHYLIFGQSGQIPDGWQP